MSERFLCGPECPPSQLSAAAAAYGRRFSSPAPRFLPHVPMKSPSHTDTGGEGVARSLKISDEEMKELEEVMHFLYRICALCVGLFTMWKMDCLWLVLNSAHQLLTSCEYPY